MTEMKQRFKAHNLSLWALLQWWIQHLKKGGGARGFGGLPASFFLSISAYLGDFLKYLPKNGGGGAPPASPPPPPGSATVLAHIVGTMYRVKDTRHARSVDAVHMSISILK